MSSPRQVISVGVVGTGRVAKALAEVLTQQADMLYGRFGTEFQVRAVMNSESMLLSETPIDLADIEAAVARGARCVRVRVRACGRACVWGACLVEWASWCWRVDGR
jgi:homoserine dehydrogenase